MMEHLSNGAGGPPPSLQPIALARQRPTRIATNEIIVEVRIGMVLRLQHDRVNVGEAYGKKRVMMEEITYA
jgi:hypothetical protein